MIHRIEVDASSKHEVLAKEFRKKLMTGGAVVRLSAGHTSEDLRCLFNEFAPVAKPHSLAELVLRELVDSDKLEPSLRAKLASTGLPGVLMSLEKLEGVLKIA